MNSKRTLKTVLHPQEDIMDLRGDLAIGGPADRPETSPPNGPVKHPHGKQKITGIPTGV